MTSTDDAIPLEGASTINPLRLPVVSVPGRGRGVFASDPIPANTLLEEAPVLLLSQKEWEDGKMNDTILGEYGFCWSGGGMALGLGIGESLQCRPRKDCAANTSASLFNHSASPNVNFIRNYASNTITFRTSRTVSAGEELCICYSADESKLWFMPSQGKRAAESEDEGDGSAALAKLGIVDDEEALRERQEAEARALAREKAREVAKETRREAGGSTHSAKERRRAKYREKLAQSPNTPSTVSNTSESTAVSTLLATSTILATAAVPRHRRPVVNADLPPALHASGSRHKHVGPVVLTPELEWNDVPGPVSPEARGVLRRAKGPVEEEEEAEADNSSTSTTLLSQPC